MSRHRRRGPLFVDTCSQCPCVRNHASLLGGEKGAGMARDFFLARVASWNRIGRGVGLSRKACEDPYRKKATMKPFQAVTTHFVAPPPAESSVTAPDETATEPEGGSDVHLA